MIKRTFDLIFSSIGFILTIPLFVYIGFKIKSEDKGPIFYKSRRAGKHNKAFFMYKFRTMLSDADKIGGPTTSDDDPRVTKIGAFLRKWKLDELPQLINVFMGEMSFVGPRPEVVSEVNLNPERYKKILSVTPGITDFASLAFPNEGEIVKGAKDPHEAYRKLIQPEKMRLQERYVDEQSFFLDIRIIVQTIITVLKK